MVKKIYSFSNNYLKNRTILLLIFYKLFNLKKGPYFFKHPFYILNITCKTNTLNFNKNLKGYKFPGKSKLALSKNIFLHFDSIPTVTLLYVGIRIIKILNVFHLARRFSI